MTGRAATFTLVMLMNAALIASIGCSDNDGFSSGEVPALTLSAPGNGSLNLTLPSRQGVPQEQDAITVLSAGAVPLTIESVAWVGEKPDRVFIRKERRDDVISSDCPAPNIYYVASGTCIETGAPTTPIEVPADSSYGIELHVAAYETGQPNIIECPDPGETVPEQIRARYCGAIRIASNGTNTEGNVTEGDTVVYLLADRSAGVVDINVPSLTFTNVAPGYQETLQFTVTNESTSSPLTIERVRPTTLASRLSVGGADDLPMELQPGGSHIFSVQLDVAANTTAEELENILSLDPAIEIESSALSSPDTVDIIIDASQVVPPVPQLDNSSLSFADATSQQLVVTNPGSEPVRLTNINFEPESISAYYEVTDADKNVGEPFGNPEVVLNVTNSNDDNQRTFDITYTPPATPDVSPVGIMILSYNYNVGEEVRGGTVQLLLLGDRISAPFGVFSPATIGFSHRTADTQTRTVALMNQGTAPLDISEVTASNAAGDETGEFSLSLLGGGNAMSFSVPAGGVQMLEVSYTPTNTQDDVITFAFTSNNDSSEALLLSASAYSVEAAPPTLEFVSTSEGMVGDLLTARFAPSVDRQVANLAEWALISRPDASSLVLRTTGPEFSFIPDVAGTYEVLVSTSNGDVDGQQTLTFTVQ